MCVCGWVEWKADIFTSHKVEPSRIKSDITSFRVQFSYVHSAMRFTCYNSQSLCGI